MYCVHGKTGDHKLELVDTGEMSYARIQREVSRIFDIDPGQLSVMRIDLAADVPGVPVSWFRRNARVKWKQWASELGEVEYSEMGRRRLETLYFGKRPNCIRIYDKVSEWRQQYRQMLRKSSDAAEVPSFEDKYKHPSDFVLTRVERQIGGCRVPCDLNKLGRLRRLEEFDPFDGIELVGGGAIEPDINDYELIEYCAGLGLRSMADEMGVHNLRSLVKSRSRGNASRIWQRYGPFLRNEGSLDSARLLWYFRQSTGRQLAA